MVPPGLPEIFIILVLGVLLVIVLIAVAWVVSAFKGKKPGTARGRQNIKLQPCPDCGREVSRKAASCPGCGCPLS